jgi:hydrogenase nickel incorporation protein HypB
VKVNEIATSQPQAIHSLELHQKVLAHNDHIAHQNRTLFQAHGILVLNVLSSPGAGKTRLLERMFQDATAGKHALRLGVIVGDLATDRDAQRLRQAGSSTTSVVQITTGSLCHLEASMVAQAVKSLPLEDLDVVMIENVGNLVCPAGFDLGEDRRVVLLSVTEGEDKPYKYPVAFKSADVILVSKWDMAEAAGFDCAEALSAIHRVAPQAQVLQLSATTGTGMADWYTYLQDQRRALQRTWERMGG